MRQTQWPSRGMKSEVVAEDIVATQDYFQINGSDVSLLKDKNGSISKGERKWN